MQQGLLDQRILYGSRSERFMRELLTNSGIFWLFDLVRKASVDGVPSYLTALPHWVLLGASIAQARIISQNDYETRWWHNFIAPTLYTVIDMVIEGPAAFFEEPYHILYWIWAFIMAGAYLIHRVAPGLSTLSKSLLLVLLLPASYMLSEWNTINVSYSDYWFGESAHLFILLGTILLGIVLGITNIVRERFEGLLYNLAGHFEQIASWSFDTQLIDQAYDSAAVLQLQRIERTVMFMDVRSFTPWSESHSPHEVVEMVNHFYSTAEPIIKANNGFKIQMTGDEIMTRFNSPDEALQCALNLQPAISATLQAYGLSAGIGLHTGDVIEGLVGSEHTRQYGIFGDTVNTAARLQGQAGANEVVISAVTWDKLTIPLQKTAVVTRELTLKGKSEPVTVHVITPLQA